MKEYFSRLNPSERRFVVGVGILFFIVLNIFFVFPYFSSWGHLKQRLGEARNKWATYNAAIAEIPDLEVRIAKLRGQGVDVPPEDQSIQFLRTIQSQAAQSGVGFLGSSRTITRTNDPFFLEQLQTINVQSGEKQLVDFLYDLGSGNSLIRVRDLAIRPDPSHMQLAASVTLVASYQKNPKVQKAAAEARASAAKPASPSSGTGPSVPKPVLPAAPKPGTPPPGKPATSMKK